jgi:hypothetical protein
MSGAHRRRDDNPIVAMLLGTWWWLWRLLLVAAVVALPFGVIALIIYLANYLESSGRELDLLAVIWLGGIAWLVDSVVRRRDQGVNWTVAGVVLTTTPQLVSAFGRKRHWPAGQLHQIDVIGRGVDMIFTAYLVVVMLIWMTSYLRRRSRGSSAP